MLLFLRSESASTAIFPGPTESPSMIKNCTCKLSSQPRLTAGVLLTIIASNLKNQRGTGVEEMARCSNR